MAITPNGFIAKNNNDTSWISQQEWNSYSQIVQGAGNLVVGHRTYDILTKQPEFSELKDVQLIVVSDKNFLTLSSNHIVAHSPKEALKYLDSFSEIIVAGGGLLNSAFLGENLVDEIYLDIEPIVFGGGIPIFRDKSFERKLKLLGTKQITDQEIQIHYQVLK
jgi:dihydrofolate reductase